VQIVNVTVKKHGVNEPLRPNALRELENAETTNAIKKENRYLLYYNK
jgi:ribosomal protein S25